jgi:chromosome segregation ATPase
MFGAIGRYLRALGYLITFRIDKAGQALRMNAGVMSANYDRIINEKRARLNQYKDAVAGLIVQEEKKTGRLRRLAEDIERLEKLRAGAAAMARQVVGAHAGDAAAVRQDPEYVKCQTAFKDFSVTLDEKQAAADVLETELQSLVGTVSHHKNQIQELMRDLEQLKEEKHDAVAEVLSAQEEKQVADLMTGLTADRTAEELRRLRELRQKVRADARVSRELAGLETQRAETQFLEYAAAGEADVEFDALTGLGTEGTKRIEARSELPKLPEG